MFQTVFALLVVAATLLIHRKHLHIGLPSDVPWLAWSISVVLIVASFGTLFWIGTITADEWSSLPAVGQTALQYVSDDSGLPSRLHRLLEWMAASTVGLQAIRPVHAVLYGVTALLLISTGRRVGGPFGVVLALALVLHYAFLERMWESRSYALFLMATCWALSAATKPAKDFASSDARILAILLPLTIAGLDNPLCWTLAAGTVLHAWRHNLLGRASLWTFGLVSLALVPLVWTAIDAHAMRLGNVRWGALGLQMVWLVPLLWAVFRGRHPMVAEATSVALICTTVLVALGVLQVGSKTFLFLAPWCWMSVCSFVPASPRLRRTLIWLAGLFLLLPSVGSSAHRIYERFVEASAARSIHTVLENDGIGHVAFSPVWKAEAFVSAVVSLRNAKHREWTHAAGIPSQYLPLQSASCVGREIGVVHMNSEMVCGCPVIARKGPWRIHRCGN